ncbi:MAG: vWA domain-containing protein [Croceimicrobium sp.]|nr:VWA domain-containing protein [Bacteroidota bacterium]
MFNYEFQNPEFLWLLCLLPLFLFWYFWRRKSSHPEIRFPESTWLANHKHNRSALLFGLPWLLRVFSIAFLIVAIARPRSTEVATQSRVNEGIDIVMAVDVSASMLAEDLKPNRLEATKEVASDFIDGRPNDRIGLVVYAGESYTQTPLTTDQGILKTSLNDLRWGLIKQGTAIGMGLATSVNRLKESKAKGKVIILLTDGENNSGEVNPLTAADWAKEFNIRVYTIGVGTKGKARTPASYDPRGGFIYRYEPVSIDEKLLTEISNKTGGQYFRATDNRKLAEIYKEIDQLEKIKLKELRFYSYSEEFSLFALWALGLFVLEILLRYTLLKSFV